MNRKEFQCILDRALERTIDRLTEKGREYAPGKDRLSAFRLAARMRGTTMAQALWGMVIKPIGSVQEVIDRPGVLTIDQAWIDEKVGDIMAYMVLLEAVLLEEFVKPSVQDGGSSDKGDAK